MVNSVSVRTGFGIDVSCPGCGGELSLQEDFATIRCKHCSSALRISMPDLPPAFLIKPKLSRMQVRPYLDRFLKENDRALSPPDISIAGIYQPYWKFDSLILRLRHKLEVRREVTEYGNATEYEQIEEVKQEITLTPHLVTISASPGSELFPYSLGLRTEYIRMRPFEGLATEDEFAIKHVETAVTHAFAQAEKGALKLSDIGNTTNARNATRLFGLKAALVYFPFFTVTFTERGKAMSYVVDAVAARVVGEAVVESVDDQVTSTDCPKFGTLGVELHRCTNCGDDLPTQNSILYYCRNCGSMTVLETNGAFDRKVAIAANGCAARSMLMPFWRLELRQVSGDGLQLAVPAFRMKNFEAMYRLSSRMSASLARIEFGSDNPIECEIAPANVSLREAVVLAHALLARTQLNHNSEIVKELDLKISGATLFLVPFHTESYFLVDSVLSAITIERQALAPV